MTFDSNRIYNNTGTGIDHEISWSATISNNVLYGNATAASGKTCWYGAQILLNNSQNVQIFGNVVTAAGTDGICEVNTARSEVAPFPTHLANVSVHDNTITTGGTSWSGVVGDACSTCTFANNRYLVDSLSALHWQWTTSTYTYGWSGWQSLGEDLNGTRALA
jgi:parallel beta-helix repeat protein